MNCSSKVAMFAGFHIAKEQSICSSPEIFEIKWNAPDEKGYIYIYASKKLCGCAHPLLTNELSESAMLKDFYLYLQKCSGVLHPQRCLPGTVWKTNMKKSNDIIFLQSLL